MKTITIFPTTLTVLVCVVVLSTILHISCDSREEVSYERQFPPHVELSLGDQFIFHPKVLSGGDAYYFVSGQDGQVWVFLQEMFQPLMAAQLVKDLKPTFEPISPGDWNNVECLSVTNDDTGNPVVFMMGYSKDARNTVVVVRKYIEQNWTEPILLDTFDGSGTFSSMLSLLDSNGYIHVIYDRNLKPRESYGFMEGYFPDKCFHAWYDGKNWNRAQSTTGRGTFYVEPRFLSELPNAKICVGMKVIPFSKFGGYKTKYVGCQLWDGKQWSDIIKKPPEEAFSSNIEDNAIFDYWGNSLTYMNKVGKNYCILKNKANADNETVTLLSPPLVKRDDSGRILVCSSNSTQGEIRIWNGNRWLTSLSYPLNGQEKIDQILSNPNGDIFLLHKGPSQITVQQIKEKSAG